MAKEDDVAGAAKEGWNSAANNEFLCAISHGIRTPINGILGMTQLLAQTPLDNLQESYLDTIHRSSWALLDIVNDILELSRPSDHSQPAVQCGFDLAALLEEVVALVNPLARDRGRELIAIPPLGLQRQLLGDGKGLRQVLLYLLTNTVEFAHRGDVVLSVELQLQPDDSAQLTILITVSAEADDRRPGVEDATTQDRTGADLRWAISQHLLRTMGGEIQIASSSRDACPAFTCRLALPLGEVLSTPAEQLAELRGKRLLIVAGSLDYRRFLSNVVGDWGVAAHHCASAEEALARIAAMSAENRAYDMVLVDQRLPQMDGMAFTSRLRQLDPACRAAVILASYVAPENNGGWCDGWLVKPIRRSALLAKMVEVLNGPPNGANPKPSPNRTTDTASVVGKKALEGIRVLLVEDNLANQKVALAMLRYLGATSVVASSGEEAVELFADCRANVVLMDCQMPTMDGYKTTRILRKMEQEKGLKATPVIALTANAMHKDRQLCLDAGMDDYLTKPIEYELLGKTILKNMALSAEQAEASTAPPPTAVFSGEKHPSGIPSGLDHEVLAQLKAVCELTELYEQILSIYLVESKRQIADLDEACQAADAVLLAEVAHGLKSCSRNVGARLLGQLLEDLEYTAKSSVPEPSETDFLYRQILAEHERVVSLIEDEMNALSARVD